MPFELIPVEVLSNVLSFAEPGTLKAVRGVNVTLASLATPLLFRNLEVWIQTQSLHKLVAITNHPILSQHVRSLTVSNDFISPDILTPYALLHCLCNLLRLPLPGDRYLRHRYRWLHADDAADVTIADFDILDISKQIQDLGWSSGRLFSIWELQKTLAIEQNHLIRTDKDVEYLTLALKNLPNLSSVRLSGGPARKLRTDETERALLASPSWSWEDNGRSFLSFFRASAATAVSAISGPSQALIASFKIESSHWENKSLRADRNDLDFSMIQPEVLSKALPFLTNISTLDLSVVCTPSRHHRDGIIGNLTALLASLRCLKTLVLRGMYHDPLDLQESFESMASTILESLEVHHCAFHLGTMERLLQTQSNNLKSIHLENTTLRNGLKYQDFFSLLRDHSPLIQFTVRGYFVEIPDFEGLGKYEEEDEKRFLRTKERRQLARERIEAFVRRDRDDLPSLEFDESEMTYPGEYDQPGTEDIVGILVSRSAKTGDLG